MTPSNSQANDVAQIRTLLDNCVKALRVKDVAAATAHLAPDVLLFDLAPPLQHRGDAVRQGLEAWFPTFKGPVDYEIRDLHIEAGGDVAFAHGLHHITGSRTSGEETDVWVRATQCLRKIDGAWKLVHEHLSVPFYMDGSNKAAVDLKP